ncbi:MAG: hypothetical protein WA323_21310 [Candidatus Nitrosopolaris sp.]
MRPKFRGDGNVDELFIKIDAQMKYDTIFFTEDTIPMHKLLTRKSMLKMYYRSYGN